MNIVADESVDRQVVDRLRAEGHFVEYVAESSPSVADEVVLDLSYRSRAILLTADKDFGELVFRQRLPHSGVFLYRLAGLAPELKAENGSGRAETPYGRDGSGFHCIIGTYDPDSQTGPELDRPTVIRCPGALWLVFSQSRSNK